jgi:hypothetical protein
LLLELKDFIKCVETRPIPRAVARDGADAVKIVETAMEPHRQGREIALYRRFNPPVSASSGPSAIAISTPVAFFLLYPVDKAEDDGYDRRDYEAIEKKCYHRFTPGTSSKI